MSAVTSLLSGMGIGAGLMYLFDPEVGQKRRDRLNQRARDMLQKAEDAKQELQQRAQGFLTETETMLKEGRIPEFGERTPDRSVLLGAGLVLYGLVRRGFTGTLMSAAGLSLLSRDLPASSLGQGFPPEPGAQPPGPRARPSEGTQPPRSQ
jgi:hypothetical protein